MQEPVVGKNKDKEQVESGLLNAICKICICLTPLQFQKYILHLLVFIHSLFFKHTVQPLLIWMFSKKITITFPKVYILFSKFSKLTTMFFPQLVMFFVFFYHSFTKL